MSDLTATTKHCDDYITDLEAPACLRAFLEFNRRPAIDKIGDSPTLFATLKRDTSYTESTPIPSPPPFVWAMVHDTVTIPAGSRVRVVMASRFGDVGITPNLEEVHGYVARVSVEDLTDFGETP